MYGLTERQRLEAIACCERIEAAYAKQQKALRNIAKIFENMAHGKDPRDGLED